MANKYSSNFLQKIRLLTMQRKIILFIFFFISVWGILSNIFPKIFYFIIDLLLAYLLLNMLYKNNKIRRLYKSLKISNLKYIMWSIFAIGIISSLINLIQPFLVIWELRTFFRGYLFFIICILYLKVSDVKLILSYFDVLLYLNLIVCGFEYFILNEKGDVLGGTFIGNGDLSLLCLIMIPYTIFRYFKYEITFKRFLFNFISFFAIASFAELKFIYYVIILVSLLALFFVKRNKRIRQYIILLPFILIIGITIVINLMGKEYFTSLIDNEKITEYVTKEGGYGFIEGSINRGTAIKQTQDIFFENKPPINKYIGYGLGSACISSIFTGPLYTNYSWTNYWYFATSYILIEQGWIGFILFLLFWVLLSRRYYSLSQNIQSPLILSCLFISLLMILNIWYNASIKGDFIFILYIFLSLPFILYKYNKFNK